MGKHAGGKSVSHTYGTHRQPAQRHKTSSQAVPPLAADINSAAATYEAGANKVFRRLLTAVASHHPKRIREFLWNASRSISCLCCRHGDDAPGPLPQLKSLSERKKPPGRIKDAAAFTTVAPSPTFSWRKCSHADGDPRAPSSGTRGVSSLILWNNCFLRGHILGSGRSHGL